MCKRFSDKEAALIWNSVYNLHSFPNREQRHYTMEPFAYVEFIVQWLAQKHYMMSFKSMQTYDTHLIWDSLYKFDFAYQKYDFYLSMWKICETNIMC